MQFEFPFLQNLVNHLNSSPRSLDQPILPVSTGIADGTSIKGAVQLEFPNIEQLVGEANQTSDVKIPFAGSAETGNSKVTVVA